MAHSDAGWGGTEGEAHAGATETAVVLLTGHRHEMRIDVSREGGEAGAPVVCSTTIVPAGGGAPVAGPHATTAPDAAGAARGISSWVSSRGLRTRSVTKLEYELGSALAKVDARIADEAAGRGMRDVPLLSVLARQVDDIVAELPLPRESYADRIIEGMAARAMRAVVAAAYAAGYAAASEGREAEGMPEPVDDVLGG